MLAYFRHPLFRDERRALLRLGLPLIGAQLAAMSMNVVDTLIAGRHSAHTLAVVALGSAMWSLVIIMGLGVMLAVTPTVSQLDGARCRQEIAPTIRQALWLGLLVGLALGMLLRESEPLLRVLDVDARLIPDTMRFLDAASLGAPALVLFFALRFYSEGLGRTQPTLYLSLLGLLVLALIGTTLVFGRYGFPELGARGAGMALAITLWLQLLGMVAYLNWHPAYRDVRPFAQWEWPVWSRIRPLLVLGAPMAVMLLMEGSLFVVSALLIGAMGPTAVASHQIAINVASVTFMVPLGLGLATTVRVGNAAGAGDQARARAAALAALFLAVIAQLFSASVLALAPAWLAALYTQDAAIIALAAQLLALAAIFQFADGLQVVSASALRGLKDARIPALITFIAYWLIGMGTGWFCAFRLGWEAPGLWYGLSAGLAAAALLLMSRLWYVIQHPERWRGA